jgi:hypothetical protein
VRGGGILREITGDPSVAIWDGMRKGWIDLGLANLFFFYVGKAYNGCDCSPFFFFLSCI